MVRRLGIALVLLLVAGCEEPAGPEPLQRLSAIVAGGEHTCGLTESGHAYCWGRGAHGQIGTGQTAERYPPVRVRKEAVLRGIVAGFRHTCALSADGVASCWGWNRYGQLGLGNTIGHGSPTTVPADRPWTALSAGWYHTCGLADTGELFCWGHNIDGAVGDGTRADRPSPVPVATDIPFAAVAAGAFHTCALSTGGEAYCWGRNTEGQLGDGTTESKASPVRVVDAPPFTAISAGRGHTCAISTTRALYCWGSNASGELGHTWFSAPGTVGTAAPHPTPRAEAYVRVSAGNDYTCAITEAEDALCWGAGEHGQLGLAHTSSTAYPTMLPSSRFGFADISAGKGSHTCGLDSARRPLCWGDGEWGELGNSTTTFTAVPLPVDRLN